MPSPSRPSNLLSISFLRVILENPERVAWLGGVAQVQEEDIPLVLERFEEEVAASLIQKRITLDTSHASVEETFAEFVRPTLSRLPKASRAGADQMCCSQVEKFEPLLGNADLLRREQQRGAAKL